MTSHIAVVDIGKTRTKLVLLRADSGEERAVRTMDNKVLPGPPYPHADVDNIWNFLMTGLREWGVRYSISGISITTHGATAALMDGEELALPVLDYEFDGPDNTAGEYAAARPGFAETLSPRLPAGLNLGAQIFWLARTYPEVFARTTAILAYPQYWAFRLTGELASEVTSLGTHTDLWAPAAADFSSLVTNQNWTRLFPPVRGATGILGNLVPHVAAQTGLDASTPVTVGIHDSNASLLPYLKSQNTPFNVISSGTWTIHMHVGGSVDRLDPDRDSLANVDYLGRPVPTARFMGGREYQELAGENSPSPTFADAQQVIDAGIMALPAFAAGVGPYPNHNGRIEGDAGALNPSERAAMASLYLALNSAAALEICGTGHTITVEGPLSRNDVYLGVLTALCDVPVIASGDATGTSLGAAMLFEDSGLATSPSEALDLNIDPAPLNGLAEYAARWRQLVAED